jgi:hypothetical protein
LLELRGDLARAIIGRQHRLSRAGEEIASAFAEREELLPLSRRETRVSYESEKNPTELRRTAAARESRD